MTVHFYKRNCVLIWIFINTLYSMLLLSQISTEKFVFQNNNVVIHSNFPQRTVFFLTEVILQTWGSIRCYNFYLFIPKKHQDNFLKPSLKCTVVLQWERLLSIKTKGSYIRQSACYTSREIKLFLPSFLNGFYKLLQYTRIYMAERNHNGNITFCLAIYSRRFTVKGLPW